MARDLTQGSAWIIAIVFSLLIFGGLVALIVNVRGAYRDLDPTDREISTSRYEINHDESDDRTIRADEPHSKSEEHESEVIEAEPEARLRDASEDASMTLMAKAGVKKKMPGLI